MADIFFLMYLYVDYVHVLFHCRNGQYTSASTFNTIVLTFLHAIYRTNHALFMLFFKLFPTITLQRHGYF